MKQVFFERPNGERVPMGQVKGDLPKTKGLQIVVHTPAMIVFRKYGVKPAAERPLHYGGRNRGGMHREWNGC
jgi:hypothetical protein